MFKNFLISNNFQGKIPAHILAFLHNQPKDIDYNEKLQLFV